MRFFAILFFLALAPTVAFGQIIPILESPIELVSIPEVPTPNQAVLISVNNVPSRDSAVYTWTVDGQVVEQGAGLYQISVLTGSLGSRTNVSVSVSDGTTVLGTKSYTLIPGELDLVWEANTYIPPFYVGKPVPTGDSTITISAIPSAIVSGTRLTASNLTYQWYINDNQSPERSGYGLSSITLTPPLFDSPFKVRVTASTQNGTLNLSESTVIVPQTPEIILYQKHSLLGTLFNRAIGDSFNLFEDEVTVRLFPLFVTNTEKAQYTWKADQNTVETEDTPREITLRKTGSGVGRASIDVNIDVTDSLYENTKRSTVITF